MRVLRPMGEAAVLLEWTEIDESAARRKALAVAAHLERRPPEGLRGWTLGARSLLAAFDPAVFDERGFAAASAAWENDFAAIAPGTLHEIPVCYGDEYGPDLDDLAAMHRMSPQQVVDLHSSATYVVYFLGFVPGFAYLGGLPEALITPRLSTPRRTVPAGSVAIGGNQAGVYPFATPGGWRLLGRTPLSLFRPDQDDMSLLVIGDRVRFVPISADQFRPLVSK